MDIDKKNQEILDELGKYLILLAERSKDVFWVRNADYSKQLYVSPAYKEVWGRDPEPLYKNPNDWSTYLFLEDYQALVERLKLRKPGVDPKDGFLEHYRIVRPSGEIRWIRDRSFTLYDKHNQCIGFAGIAEDITNEKLYGIKLQQEKERAQIANLAKSNFIASMSHDFRTPLNSILGMAEILRSEKYFPEQKEFIDGILQAGNALLNMVEEILNFVTLDLNKLPLQETWFNFKRLVEEVALTMGSQAHEKKIEIIMNYSDEAPIEVYGDANRMRRILFNLLNNAIKFTDKGHVFIGVELKEKLDDNVLLQAIVEDTGIGIAKKNFDFIFGSFNRVDPSYRGRYKGTGLGLTIVKQFVEDMGGSITFNSKLNKGSVFYCTVPFKLTNHSSKIQDHYSEMKVLLIDDYRKRAKTFLKQFALKYGQIVSSKYALKVLKKAAKRNNPFDLVIIDEEIAYDDPMNLAEWVSENETFKKTKMLFVASETSSYTMEEITAVGFEDVLVKPYQPIMVVQMLEHVHAMLSTQAKQSQRAVKKEFFSVLLVEDDVLTQRVTRWMLEELKCQVDIASTARKALELLEKKYDFLLLDIGLPDISGIELAKMIREQNLISPETPMVALTAHVLEKDKKKCLSAGMNDFLKKPVLKNDLKRLLLRLL